MPRNTVERHNYEKDKCTERNEAVSIVLLLGSMGKYTC